MNRIWSKEYYNIAKENYLAALDDLKDKFKYSHEWFRNPPYLIDFVAYISWKDDYINKLDKEPTSIDWLDILKRSLDLIWRLLKERKVKVERFDIYDVDEEEVKWDVKELWYLDPCKYEDEKELEREIEEWKGEVIREYEELTRKYGTSSANILLDIIPVVRSDCYEWEIRIE